MDDGDDEKRINQISRQERGEHREPLISWCPFFLSVMLDSSNFRLSFSHTSQVYYPDYLCLKVYVHLFTGIYVREDERQRLT